MRTSTGVQDAGRLVIGRPVPRYLDAGTLVDNDPRRPGAAERTVAHGRDPVRRRPPSRRAAMPPGRDRAGRGERIGALTVTDARRNLGSLLALHLQRHARSVAQVAAGTGDPQRE